MGSHARQVRLTGVDMYFRQDCELLDLVHDPLDKAGETAGIPGEVVLGIGGDGPGHLQLHVLGRQQADVGLGLPLYRQLHDAGLHAPRQSQLLVVHLRDLSEGL